MALDIPERKPARVPCPHLCGEGGGCGSYVDRWPVCHTFRCLWLTGHLTPEAARPDLLGVVVYLAQLTPAERRSFAGLRLPETVAMVVECAPGGLARAAAVLRALARQATVITRDLADTATVYTEGSPCTPSFSMPPGA